MRKKRLWFRVFVSDPFLVIPTLILLCSGLFTLKVVDNVFHSSFFIKQLIYLLGSAVFGVLLFKLGSKKAPVLFVVGYLVNLVLLFYLALKEGDVNRWIHVGPLTFLPSEFMKFFSLGVLAVSSVKIMEVSELKKLVWISVICGLPAFLIAKQPDLGTALFYAGEWLFFVLLFSAKKRTIFTVLVLIALSAYPFWLALKPYQRERLVGFLHPEENPSTIGYQTLLSQVVLGSGGKRGTFWDGSYKSYLEYLPARHTDFIFSSFVNLSGFAGGLMVVLCFWAILVSVLFKVASNWDLSVMFRTYGCGVVYFFSFHFFINVAMCLGLAPATGVPLPFMSYGGSFLLTSLAVVIYFLKLEEELKSF